MRILILEPIDLTSIHWLREQGADVILGFDDEEWDSQADDIHAIIYRSMAIDESLMERLPALRVIGKHGVGINTIDTRAAAERGIVVTNTPGANANSVSEQAVALLLSATRDLGICDASVRDNRFTDRLSMPLRNEVTGTKLGIIGAGAIGRRVAEIMSRGFDCAVGFFDPYVDPDRISYLTAMLFETPRDLCSWASNLVIAAPLTDETLGLVGLDDLRALGSEAVVVVASRGGIVSEGALVEALREGLIRGAGVDSYETEPPAEDNPLFDLVNVVLVPHMGGHTKEARRRMAQSVVEQVWALLNGGRAPVVGRTAWETDDSAIGSKPLQP